MPGARDLTLTQLTYFVSAAETRSMTAAASELFVAQSAVSTSIANLEQIVGAQLFIRRRAKGLELTSAGTELLGRARAVLTAVDDAVGALRPESVAGRISVGCFRTLVPFLLPRITRILAEASADLHVDFQELTADQVEEALESRAIEIALTYDLGLGPEVQREVLDRLPLYAFVAFDHPLAARESVSLAELADEPMVVLDLPRSRDYFISAFTTHGVRPWVRYRFGNFEAVRAMVADGHGFTVLNQQPKLGYTYQGTQLHRLRITDKTEALDLVLAWPANSGALTRKAELVAAACREVVRADAPGGTDADQGLG